jgi:hypothetical protein
MTYRGRIEKGVVILDEKTDLPDGTVVRVEPVIPESTSTLAEQLADVIGTVPDLPVDMAEQHDHYLRGTPKR